MLTNEQAINVLNGMRRRCTNSSGNALISRVARENEAIDMAIKLLKEAKSYEHQLESKN